MKPPKILDEDLRRIARRLSGMTYNAELVRESLKAFAERESARRLAALGGTMPGLKAVPRHRTR